MQQVYKVPSGVTLLYVEALGAYSEDSSSQYDGHGAEIMAYLPVTPGEMLYTEVGQPGSVGGAATFGGGAAPGEQSLDFPDAAAAWSGGGATTVQTCSETASSCPGGASPKKSRLIVAGGGGGAGGVGSDVYDYCSSSADGGGANASGDGIVTTSAGSFLIGGGGDDTSPSTPAGGGTDTRPGAGGLQADCTFENESFPGSVAGSNGSGLKGGSGASATGEAGAGGGGGGGYFGGGGGASGSTCVSDPVGSCSAGGDGSGGGSGSSFVSSVATFSGYGGAVTPPSVTYTPVIKIKTPRDGATYTKGEVVDASWVCDQNVLQSCTGTVASGQPIDTSTVGSQTFVVQSVVSANDQDATVKGTVTYTVARHT